MTAAPGENPPLTGTHRECCPRSPLLRRAHERRKVMSQQPTVVIDGVTYVPAPPIEEAPAPEPVARWTACNLGCGWSSLRCGPDLNHPSHEDATAAVDALNTLDATGIVWGEPRPMSELPKAGRVLARHQNGGVYEREAKFLRLHGGPHLTGWYGPLPEVTP